MTDKTLEAGAVTTTLLTIAAVVALPFWYQHRHLHEGIPAGARVITLTAVAASGNWTEDSVNGENYWRRDFPAARPVLTLGQPVAFRIKSADVTHEFYAPELGLGPIEAYPGHVVEKVITPTKAGIFDYYCLAFCGRRHFGMRGEIVVEPPGKAAPPPAPAAPGTGHYWAAAEPPSGAPFAERGKWIFHQRGCVTCHGEGGRGGVPNFNYARGTVPALAGISDRFMLYDPEDVQSVVKALGKEPLDALGGKTDIPHFAIVLSQYHAVHDVIHNGSVSAKKDPNGPEPPLQMPTWGGRLSSRDIDAVIAYLLTLPPPAGA